MEAIEQGAPPLAGEEAEAAQALAEVIPTDLLVTLAKAVVAGL